MRLNDLKESLLSMPYSKAIDLICKIRANRLVYKPSSKSKKSSKTTPSNTTRSTKAKQVVPPMSLDSLKGFANGMSDNQRLELLRRLTGGKKG